MSLPIPLRPFAPFALAVLLAWTFALGACAPDERADPDAAGVTDAAKPAAAEGSAAAGTIELPDDTTIHPGQTIDVSYALDGEAGTGAWLGLVPASVTSTTEADNDAADVQWVQVPLGESVGELAIVAAAPGRYRLRIFSSDAEDGALVAESDPFGVEAWPEQTGALAIELDGGVLEAGGELPPDTPFTVRYELPWELPESAWIGLVPASVTTRDEPANDAEDVRFEYLGGATSGTVELAAPEPGEWMVRLFPCDEEHCPAISEAGPFRVVG